MIYQTIAIITQTYFLLTSFPGSHAGEENKELGTDVHMYVHQVLLVTCILLCNTKITVNFLFVERADYRIILPVRHIRAVLKSAGRCFDGNDLLFSFEAIDELQRGKIVSVTCYSI